MTRKFTNLELSKLSIPVKLSQNTHSDFFCLDRKCSDVTCKVAVTSNAYILNVYF